MRICVGTIREGDGRMKVEANGGRGGYTAGVVASGGLLRSVGWAKALMVWPWGSGHYCWTTAWSAFRPKGFQNLHIAH